MIAWLGKHDGFRSFCEVIPGDIPCGCGLRMGNRTPPGRFCPGICRCGEYVENAVWMRLYVRFGEFRKGVGKAGRSAYHTSWIQGLLFIVKVNWALTEIFEAAVVASGQEGRIGYEKRFYRVCEYCHACVVTLDDGIVRRRVETGHVGKRVDCRVQDKPAWYRYPGPSVELADPVWNPGSETDGVPRRRGKFAGQSRKGPGRSLGQRKGCLRSVGSCSLRW